MSDPKMERIPGAGGKGFDEELYVQKFLRQVQLRTQKAEWFVHTGKAWEIIEPERFQPVVKQLLPRGMRSAKNIMAVIAGAQADRQLKKGEGFVSAVVFDRADHAVWVNCQNGVLKVGDDSVSLCPHGSTPHLFSAYLNAEWRGEYLDEMTPLFGQVVCDALPDNQDRALLHWFSGYLLYPSCKHEIILINYGGGGTGKSTISDAVMAVIGGAPLKTVLSLAQLCAEGQGAYSLPSLKRAIVNYGGEIDTVDTKDSANIKLISSGESFEVRSIYGQPGPMTDCTVKLWFNSNTIPRFKNGTDAELRRLRFIHFTRAVSEERKDRELKAKLVEERHGVFSWMVQSLQFILRGGVCPEGGGDSTQIKQRFALANDPVRAFGEACCVFGPDEEEPKQVVADAFGAFMDSWGYPPRRKEDMFRKLYERFPGVHPVRKRIDGADERQHWLVGISLKEQPSEPIRPPAPFVKPLESEA